MRRLIGILGFLLTFIAAAAFAQKGPAEVKIDAAAKKQPAVVFPHAKHVALAKTCDTCHHTNKGMTTDKGVKVEKCSACHLDPKDKAPSMREMGMDKNPFHIKCIGCHKTEGKGPKVCKDCHKK